MDPVVEKDLRALGLNKIAGVDEVGRGSGAGPVVVFGVILPIKHKIVGLNDSKKLTPKRRGELSSLIYERAIEIHSASADHSVVDKINILEATKLCMLQVANKFTIKPDMVVIDGKFNFDGFEFKYPFMCYKKADEKSDAVAAGSILAKTHRDAFMDEQHKLYPEYGFINHHGYLTKEHIAALKKYGPCPIHRLSFTVKGVKINEIKDN